MDCQTLAPLIDSYLANDLQEETMAKASAHLAACPYCRARVADFASLERVLNVIPREPASPLLALRIQRQVHAARLRRRIGHTLPVAVTALASALLFVWLAGSTFMALQDAALWEIIGWFASMPELLWQHPIDVLGAFADFAPIGGLLFTMCSAFTSWVLIRKLVAELLAPMPTSRLN